LKSTWPGMSISRPERLDLSRRLTMFCYEDRIPRELFWAGFGFQIWCQLLTHIVRASDTSLLVVDEPEVYLHPDVQRQLLGIVRDAGPDIIMATHSTEIMGDADASEIVLIDKMRRSAERLRDVKGIQEALDGVGSVQNISLTRLARNRRILFIEGESDFRILRRFARQQGLSNLAAGGNLTVVESGGFDLHDRIGGFGWGIQRALSGSFLSIAAVFDRDYRCDEEIGQIEEELKKDIQLVHFHQRKEIENYLLVPDVLQRAVEDASQERQRRTGERSQEMRCVREILEKLSENLRHDVVGQYVSKRQTFLRSGKLDQATIAAETSRRLEDKWKRLETRMEIVPGKRLLQEFRTQIQDELGVTLTDQRILQNFRKTEVPGDLVALLHGLDRYRPD
jgi:hypothetical protein